MAAIKTIIAFIIITLSLCGCKTEKPKETAEDIAAFEQVKAVDEELALETKRITAHEEDIDKALIPMAEHLALKRKFENMAWGDIKESASEEAEIMVLEDVEDESVKFTLTYSKKTHGVHLFILRKMEDKAEIIAHTILSKYANSQDYKCLVTQKGEIGRITEEGIKTECIISQKLIDATTLTKRLLQGRHPDSQRGSALTYATGTNAFIFSRGNEKIVMLRDENILALLTTRLAANHTSETHFVGFFPNGY